MFYSFIQKLIIIIKWKKEEEEKKKEINNVDSNVIVELRRI